MIVLYAAMTAAINTKDFNGEMSLAEDEGGGGGVVSHGVGVGVGVGQGQEPALGR